MTFQSATTSCLWPISCFTLLRKLSKADKGTRSMLSHVCLRLAIDFVVIVMINFYFVFVKKQRKMPTERKVKLKKRI